MKTKYLLCIVILLATGGSLFAQNPTNVTGIITDPSSVAYYPAQVTACLTPVTIDPTVGGKHVNPNIGANYCIGPIPTAPSGAFSMALYANGNITPGATQWVFTVQTAGSGPPAGKGAQAFSSAAVTISGSSQDVSTNLNSVGPTQLNSSSSSSSSPNAPTIYAWDAKYNLPQPAKWVCDATFTSGSPTVTTPVTDRPFLSTDSFAIVVGGAAQCGGNPQATITTLTPANATATFVSAHTITLSGNALASCTPTGTQGGCALFWGPDHTAAIQAAFNDAANNCGTLVLPAGGLIVNSIVNNTTSLCPLVAGANGEPSAVTVKGQGPWSTMLLFTPNVSFAASSMFGTISGGINVSLHDFGVASFTQATAGFAGQSGFFLYFNSNMYNVWFLDFFPSNANSFRAVSIGGVVNAVTSFHDNELLNSGFIGLNVTGNCVNIFNNWLQGSTQEMQISAGSSGCGIVTWGNQFNLCGTQGCVSISGSGSQWFSDNDYFTPNGASLPGVSIFSSFGAYMHNAHINNSPTTTSPALSVTAGQTAVIDGENSVISTTGGTGNAVTNAGNLTLRNVSLGSTGGVGLSNSGTVTFKEGNSIANGITNTGVFQGQRGNGVETGACTGVVTSATTVGLFQLGQLATSTCTTATVGLGQVMSKGGTVYALYCTATAGNQATSACTALKNGAAQTMTCSLNALATCTDGTTGHTFTYVAGDILSVEAIAGTADTLANVKGLLVTN